MSSIDSNFFSFDVFENNGELASYGAIELVSSDVIVITGMAGCFEESGDVGVPIFKPGEEVMAFVPKHRQCSARSLGLFAPAPNGVRHGLMHS